MMKGGKAMGPDCIPIEVWRGLGDKAIVWLTKLFNLIFRSNKMLEEWMRSILVPIFKNKGDVQSCTNYRGIKLMSHTMKLWERLKSIWFHAWEVDHGSHFLGTTTYGEIQGAKEGHVYGVH